MHKRHAHTAERCVKVKILKPIKTSNSMDNLLIWEGVKVKVCAHVFISGRVQGVFFRSQTKHNADNHDVKGWVRNLLDGRLEAVFEGEKEAVQMLIEFCKLGPSGARVTNIDLTWEPYTGTLDKFKIKYS
jgi:acylphosphatase